MQITEVRIKLVGDSDDRLLAFCSITFDGAFVVRDLKIIEGTNGLFVAMPSRKITTHCPSCSYKNALRSAHCNRCGADIRKVSDPVVEDGRRSLYADIAHPIHADCREMIERSVLAEYEAELVRADRPDYVCRYDQDYRMDGLPIDASSAALGTESRSANKFPSAPHFQMQDSPSSGVRPTVANPGIATPPTRSNDEFGKGIF